MSVIPSPLRVTSGFEGSFTLTGSVLVSYSGEGAAGIAGYLCNYLNLELNLDSLADPQEDAGTCGGDAIPDRLHNF